VAKNAEKREFIRQEGKGVTKERKGLHFIERRPTKKKTYKMPTVWRRGRINSKNFSSGIRKKGCTHGKGLEEKGAIFYLTGGHSSSGRKKKNRNEINKEKISPEEGKCINGKEGR